MLVLFVHGMGRSPLSAWPMLATLRRNGLRTATFAYSAMLDDVRTIEARLVKRIVDLAAGGDYVLIGHSLGGVLLRAALYSLHATCRRPGHIFLLGSPIAASRLAIHFSINPLFRLSTGDCGQMLSSPERMAAIAVPREPTTSIVGVKNLVLTRRFFDASPNDGIVSVSEVSADWIAKQIQVPVIHSLLPASQRVAEIIIEELKSVHQGTAH